MVQVFFELVILLPQPPGSASPAWEMIAFLLEDFHGGMIRAKKLICDLTKLDFIVDQSRN